MGCMPGRKVLDLAHEILSVVTDTAKMSSGSKKAPPTPMRVTLPATDRRFTVSQGSRLCRAAV